MIINKRIKRLEKVLYEYLPYTKWRGVQVFEENNHIFVVWLSPRIIKNPKSDDGFYINFSHRVFPAVDINKRIRSYKDKIVIEKAKLKEIKDEKVL